MKIFSNFILLLLSTVCFAQPGTSFDVPRELFTEKIDIQHERVFIYIKPNVKIIYRISDILEYIDSVENSKSFQKSKNLQFLKDTLLTSSNNIEIIDYCYSYDSDKRENIIRKDNISSNVIAINNSFEYMGSDLVLKGKFRVYSLKDKSYIDDGLRAVKSEGLYGTEYLDFLFPDNTKFYSIVIALGE